MTVIVYGEKLVVRDGHHRLQAARELGLRQVPFLNFSAMSRPQKSEYTKAVKRYRARSGHPLGGGERGLKPNPPSSTRLIGYHGTLRPMERPEIFKGKGMDFGPGFYLATDVQDALSYTNSYEPVVYEAEVELKNPIVISHETPVDKVLVARVMKALGGGLEDVEPFYDHPMVGVFEMARTLVDVGTIRPDALRSFLQKLGYDGVYVDRDIIQKQMDDGGGTQQIHGDYIAVFSPEQILSWKKANVAPKSLERAR